MATPVLVVGAGVTGCVLALELAHHGVESIVLERAAHPPRQPELNLIDGRAMELLRRLGLARTLRERGVDPDAPAEVVFARQVGDPPVHVRRVPSVNELRPAELEPYLLVSGTDLVAGLRAAARAHPLVDLREGCTFTDMRVEGGSAVVTVLDAATGTRRQITARYLAGCDGAQSTVRRCLGVVLEELRPPVPHLTVYLRGKLPGACPGTSTMVAGGIVLSRRREDDVWVGHLPLTGINLPVVDPSGLLRDRLGAGADGLTVLGVVQWDDGLGVARTYRLGPAYLAGQAAHRFHPPSTSVTTSVGDAVDLGWKLAGAVHGWAGPQLLASYEQERRPRALIDRERVRRRIAGRLRFGELAESGATSQDLAGVALAEASETRGADTYPQSTVVWREPRDGLPVTRPGVRPPAVRLAGGAPLFDLLGPEFTLVDMSGAREGHPLVASARDRGIPMTFLDVTDAGVAASWGSRLVLVRPDQHIAWRGDARPSDWDRVLSVVTGHHPQEYANT